MPTLAKPVELDPEFVSLTEASRLLSLGKTTLHKLINEGRLDTLKCGKKRLVRLRAIRDFGKAA